MRKSSARVTLVLVGMAALAGCQDQRRDVYATREDCLADWGNKPEDCTPATEPRHAASHYWYGPHYTYSSGGSGWTWGTSRGVSRSSSSSRSIGSSSSHASRGGFGSSAHSSGG